MSIAPSLAGVNKMNQNGKIMLRVFGLKSLKFGIGNPWLKPGAIYLWLNRNHSIASIFNQSQQDESELESYALRFLG